MEVEKLSSSTVNLLLTGAGTQTFANVFSGLKLAGEKNLKIVAADISSYAYGLYLADKHYLIPKATSKEFIPVIKSICKKEKINIIFPLLSLEFPMFAKNKKIFKHQNIEIPISDLPAINVCMDKKSTYIFFKNIGIPTPNTYLPDELPSTITYPLIIKPRSSSGTKSVYKVNSQSELVKYLPIVPKPIIQEFLLGEEYTIDILANYKSKPLVIVPRKRLATMDGKCTKGIISMEKPIINETAKIIQNLKLIGPANIQGFKVGKKFVFTEINPRFSAGGLPLTISAGANTPLMLLNMALGKFVNPVNSISKDMIMLRYFTAVCMNKSTLKI